MKNLETGSVNNERKPSGSKASPVLNRLTALVGMTVALNLGGVNLGCESDDLPQIDMVTPPVPTENGDAGADQDAANDALNNTDSPVDAGSDSAEASQSPTLDAGNEEAAVLVDCAGKGQYGEDLMNCNNVCVDSLNDVNNCGKCGNTCNGAACENGSCKAVQCETPNTMCGGKCVDVNSDKLNCGECDMPCAPNQNCENGICK